MDKLRFSNSFTKPLRSINTRTISLQAIKTRQVPRARYTSIHTTLGITKVKITYISYNLKIKTVKSLKIIAIR